MKLKASKIYEDYKKIQWDSKPMESVKSLTQENDYDELTSLIKLFLSNKEESTTFIDAALSFIPKDEFYELINESIQILKEDKNEIAVSIITYGVLQFPDSFLTKLEEFLYLIPDPGSYYDRWMWRKAKQNHIEKLREIIVGKHSMQEKMNAWECLSNIESLEAIKTAIEIIDDRNGVEGLELILQDEVHGFKVIQNTIKSLLINHQTLHIVFPNDYSEDIKNKWHPTWNDSNEFITQTRFGGTLQSKCKICNSDLSHLISIPKSILNFDKELKVSTCLNCLGWEEHQLFYQHDDQGIPKSINSIMEISNSEEDSNHIIETTVKIVSFGERWMNQDWALSNGRENLSRIGGKPTWIQAPEYIQCPKCNDMMKFIFQIDSFLPTSDGELLWGSGGICYIHYCEDCSISGMNWQCT